MAVKRQSNTIKPIYQFFSDKLQNINLNDISYISEALFSLQFIRLTVTSVDQAYELFERVNARGADLEVSDLLKNKLFANVRDQDDRDVVQLWDEITLNADDNLIRMLKYFYVSREGYITRSKLYTKIKDRFGDDYERLILDLEHFSNFYNTYQKYECFLKLSRIKVTDQFQASYPC